MIAEIRPLGGELAWIKEYLRGSNPRIRSADMIKTTPPGRGSRMLRLGSDETAWGNRSAGGDLAEQVDPEFVPC